MKNIIITLSFLMFSFTSFAQLTIEQSIVTPPPYKVGDTITIKYTIDRGLNPVTTPRYSWLRYQFNNKALTYLSTTFSQGSSVQTFYTGWSNFRFNPSQSVDVKSLYGQYQSNPWSYTQDPNWNVAQLTVQRADAPIDGILATQKYIIKDQNLYSGIHKLDLAYAVDASGVVISPITTTSNGISMTNVTGNTSQFKVRVLFPQGYNITDHRVQLMRLKTDGTNTIDWSQQPIVSSNLDSSGEAIFTSGVKVGDSFGVFVSAPLQKTWMDNIVTVSDAYRSFLGHSQSDISGNPTFFTFPNLEKNIGNVTINDNTFNESDSYYLFAHVMGQNVSSNALIPSSTSVSVKYFSGLLNQSWINGTPTNNVTITNPIQEVNAVFAWGGDLDWSHSSSPTEISSRLGSVVSSTNKDVMLSTKKIISNSYVPPVLENVKVEVISKLENGKVTLTTSLSKSDLAGLEIIMNYDNSKLSLDRVVFDSGSTITNFTTDNNGRLTFGSIDQTKTSRIKSGIPYRLVFTPKIPITNTSGLFFFVLSDAVDGNGKKVNLIIE
jgi:hypothetical protein